jgi:hypothetical protein
MTIIEDIGETVTARTITKSFNEYGDATNTTGSGFVSGLIVPMNADYNDVKMGILDTQDAIGIFAGTETSIVNGNEIYCTLGSFSIQNAQKFVLGGTIHHIECELKRVLT